MAAALLLVQSCTHDIDLSRLAGNPEGDEPGECGDGIDNDGDGLFDCDDEGCVGSAACDGADGDADRDGDGPGACEAAGDCQDRENAHCDETSQECVPCDDSAQCGHISGPGECIDGVCVECTTADTSDCPAEREHCSAEHRCVECLEAAHCTNVGASQCEDGACVPCEDGSDECSHLPDTPICYVGTCVECVTLADCDPESETPVCHEEQGRCVGCTENADCLEPAAAWCDTTLFQCDVCSAPEHCAHLDPLLVCDEGVCVGCVSHADCAAEGTLCNFTTNLCVRPCFPCSSDSNCTGADPDAPGAGFVCASDWTGRHHCFQTPVAACERPWIERDLPFGPDVRTVCGPPSMTSCQGVAEFGNECASSSSCGQDGVDDGTRCHPVTGGDDYCTYYCATDDECPPGASCLGPFPETCQR